MGHAAQLPHNKIALNKTLHQDPREQEKVLSL